MPFALRKLADGARVVELARPGQRGNPKAEGFANALCNHCRQPIGIDTLFHEVNEEVYHASCAAARVRDQGWTPPLEWGMKVPPTP